MWPLLTSRTPPAASVTTHHPPCFCSLRTPGWAHAGSPLHPGLTPVSEALPHSLFTDISADRSHPVSWIRKMGWGTCHRTSCSFRRREMGHSVRQTKQLKMESLVLSSTSPNRDLSTIWLFPEMESSARQPGVAGPAL